MPLHLSSFPNLNSRLLVWSIDETIDELHTNIVLTEQSKQRMNSMKSDLHQRAFLSVRQLLLQLGYADADLHYDVTGKPHLRD
ncbi:MAG: 4-phosphopantetheinyl transferase, partial [Flavobacterium sp.]|nr:4-phosphopantetheinyl transferase [Flavobacterium sp.]